MTKHLPLVALLAGLLAWSVARADEPRRPNTPVLHGAVGALDLKVGTITIEVRGDNAYKRTLNLHDKVKVQIDGKPAKLADVKVGMVVRAELDPATEDVVTLAAAGPTQRARIRAVDVEAGTLTVVEERANRSLKLAPDVQVTINGRAAKPADVQQGAIAFLQLSADGQLVRRITVGRAAGREEGRRPVVRGALKAIDVAGGTITLTLRGDGGEREEKYALDKEVKVFQGERPMQLEDLRVLGIDVLVQLAPDRRTVVQIAIGGRRGDGPREGGREGDREGGRFTAVLKSVDPAKGTLTMVLSTPGGDFERTYALEKDVKVQLAEQPAKLEALRPGMRLGLSLSPDRTRVLAISGTGAVREER